MNSYAVYPFPFGFLKIGYEGDAVTCLKSVPPDDPKGQKTPLTDRVYGEIMEYLDGKRRHFDFPIELHGTDFQKKVWNQLQKIPYGETRTYKDIAIAAGCPRGFRAVGMANHNNPISIIVPCHRVIGSGGKLTGYGGGLEIKEYLLELERRFS